MSKRSSAIAFAMLAIVATGCRGTPPAPVGTPAVTVQITAYNLHFEPQTLTVPANQTFAIELNNKDAAPHNVVISGGGISRTSDPFSGPQTRTFVFAALPPGTYGFACSIHPEMTGVVESSTTSHVP